MATLPTPKTSTWPTGAAQPPFSDGKKKGKTANKVAAFAAEKRISSPAVLPTQSHAEPNRSMIKLKHTINVFNEIKKQLLSLCPELKIDMSGIIGDSFSVTENNMANWIERNRESVDKLEVLNIEKLKLDYLPKFLEKLTSLKALNLQNNELTDISPIRALKNLQKLVLSNNKLDSLPEWIGELENIQGLHLSNNNLTDIPPSISKLKKLQVIYLSGNLITRVPEILIKMGNDNKDKRLYKFMICYVGDSYSQEHWLGEKISLDGLSKKSYIHCLNNKAISTLFYLGIFLACTQVYSFFYKES